MTVVIYQLVLPKQKIRRTSAPRCPECLSRKCETKSMRIWAFSFVRYGPFLLFSNGYCKNAQTLDAPTHVSKGAKTLNAPTRVFRPNSKQRTAKEQKPSKFLCMHRQTAKVPRPSNVPTWEVRPSGKYVGDYVPTEQRPSKFLRTYVRTSVHGSSCRIANTYVRT